MLARMVSEWDYWGGRGDGWRIRRHAADVTSSSKIFFYSKISGTTVAQWLRCCATNRKVAGSIPAGVTGIFH